MRIALTLSDDAHQIARLYAKERNLTLGEAIGELVRKGAERDSQSSHFLEGCQTPAPTPGTTEGDTETHL
jgi:hypothetical protein